MNNRQPQISFIYDRRGTGSSTKKAPVEMRITHNYKQKYISTGIMLYPNQWKKGKITNCPDIVQISKVLDTLVTNIRQIILNMMSNGEIDIDRIPEELKKETLECSNFIQFCNQRALVRKYGKTKDSQERYNRFIRLFTQWGGIVEFKDINESNIIRYDKYLIERNLKPYSKWNNYHRFLNSFIIDAIEEGLLQRNPYKWVNIERGKLFKSSEKYLTPSEFNSIKKATMCTQSLERVRDLFIFQTYTCMSYSELVRFDLNNIQTIKGRKVYLGFRKKTNKPFTIPLLSEALRILNKYDNHLPIISNVKYNEYLKVVAQAAGIEKPISSHWARHTGATMLLNEGVAMQIVSRICGHSSIKITEQVYAKLLDETVVDALANIKL